jgi:hypothetical protein
MTTIEESVRRACVGQHADLSGALVVVHEVRIIDPLEQFVEKLPSNMTEFRR